MNLRTTLFLAVLLTAGCATNVGNVTFPQPTTNFVPKKTYEVSYDKLWDATLFALESNRLTAVSTDKGSGVIQTDYIEGVTTLYAGGFIAGQNTRYKYNLTLRKQDGGAVRLNIVAKLESTMRGQSGSSPWTDVTGQNAMAVMNLESWLYEQIEKRL